MPDLNSTQFSQVFDQMGQMDRDHPTPSYQQHKDTPLFHGTPHAIKDGMVRPADDVDKEPSEASFGDPGDMSEGDHAFATHDEHYAWNATSFHRNGMRPRVYQVDAAPDMKPGPWNKDHPDFLHHVELDDPKVYEGHPELHRVATEEVQKAHMPEFGSPTGFPVRKRIDIMPGHQGTFPEFNWNRFKPDGHRSQMGYEMSHPNDDQIKNGTEGKGLIGDREIDKPVPPVVKPQKGDLLREAMGRPPRKPKEDPTLF